RDKLAKTVPLLVLISPTWVRGQRRDRIVTASIEDALRYGLFLISERTDLCRCRWSGCNRFFFRRITGRGRPRRDCPEHTVQAGREIARLRMKGTRDAQKRNKGSKR